MSLHKANEQDLLCAEPNPTQWKRHKKPCALLSENVQSIGRAKNHMQKPTAEGHRVATSSLQAVKEHKKEERQPSWWNRRGRALEKTVG